MDATPILDPTPGNFWDCAAVQPNLVYVGPGEWHLFFKAWQEVGKVCDDATGNADGQPDPAWGCDTVTGVGHATSTDGVTWTVGGTLPILQPSVIDPSPEDFGWPRVVRVTNTWMLFMNYGDNGITLATATDPAGPWVWEGFDAETVSRSEALEPSATLTWMEDELIVADVTCNDEPEDHMLNLWFGGHDREEPDYWGTPVSRALGFAQSPHVTDWEIGDPPEILWSENDISTDVAWRSWSAVPVGADDYIIYYQRKTASGNEVGLAYTTVDTAWDLNDVRTADVCTYYGDAPVTTPDAYDGTEDAQLTVAAPGVLIDDADLERNAFTAALDTDAVNGTVVMAADGSFTYTPNPDFTGEDTFTYIATDTTTESAPTLVTITVAPLPDLPVGTDDAYSVDEDVTLTVDVKTGVLANDVDVDGDTLTVTLVDEPEHGTVTLQTDGQFTYEPEANYFGPDAFTYMVNDGTSDALAITTVTLTVDSVNDAPVAQKLCVHPGRGHHLGRGPGDVDWRRRGCGWRRADGVPCR